MGVNGEGLQVHGVCIFHYKSHENPYQYYRSRAVSEREVHMVITIVQSYTGKKYHLFVKVGIVTRAAHS